MVTDFAQVTLSLEQLKVAVYNPTQMQLLDDMRGVHDRVIRDIRHDEHWCKG